MLNKFRSCFSNEKIKNEQDAEEGHQLNNTEESNETEEMEHPKRTAPYFLKYIIQLINYYNTREEQDQTVQYLRREILLSPSCKLDELDKGGERKYGDVLGEIEHERMCVLERILYTFNCMRYKDCQTTDVVELVLIKSRINYREYKNGRVLNWLKQYDLIKFYQWQILNNEGEDFIREMEQSENLYLQENNIKKQEENMKSEYDFLEDASSAKSTGNSLSTLDTISDNLKKRWSKLKTPLKVIQVLREPVTKYQKKFMLEESAKGSLKDKVIKTVKNLDELFEVVFAAGSLVVLKYLMEQVKKENLQSQLLCPIIINAVYWSVYVKPENIDQFYECFEYVLNDEDTDLCVAENNFGDTALHTANNFKDEYLIKKIFEKRPPIAIKNHQGEFPVSNIAFKDLKQYFDSIIMDIPKRLLPDSSVWKIICGIYLDEYNLRNVIFMDLYPLFYKPSTVKQTRFNDLELIQTICSTSHLHKLIDHPVISTIIELHWMKFKKFIWIDQMPTFFVLFASFILFILHIMIRIYSDTILPQWIEYLLAGLTTFVLVFEVLKNYQIIISCKNYFTEQFNKLKDKCHDSNSEKEIINSNEKIAVGPKSEKVLPYYTILSSLSFKIPLLILIIMFLVMNCGKDSCMTIVGAGTVLVSVNLTLLAGYYSKYIAHNMIMLICVAVTGIRFLFSTFLILLGFAVSLSIVLNDFRYTTDAEKENDNLRDINGTNVWTSFGLGLLKTVIMSTGEFEASDFKFNGFIAYIIFVSFVFTIPIVFMNLLNALAIEDVQKIKREAMIWYRKAQLMVLYEFECLMWTLQEISPFFHKYKFDTDIYPSLIGKYAFIGIRLPTLEVFSMDDVDSDKHTHIGYLSIHTVKKAKKIIQNQDSDDE